MKPGSGLLFLSQSRLVNGASRLQPTCFATGQAAGVIAAKSIERRVQPRALPPLVVQAELLAANDALSLQGFVDAAATRGDAAELAARTLLRFATTPGPVGACYRTPPAYCER